MLIETQKVKVKSEDPPSHSLLHHPMFQRIIFNCHGFAVKELCIARNREFSLTFAMQQEQKNQSGRVQAPTVIWALL